MKDLQKVSRRQIFDTWKNVSLSLGTVIAVVIACKIFPFYISPINGLAGSALLYTVLYRNKVNRGSACMLIPYTMFFCLISFSFLSIAANVFYIWGFMQLPDEFIFFNDPYIPTLWLNPICFVTVLVIIMRRKKLLLCTECRMRNGAHVERGVFGSVINSESRFQLNNLLYVFLALSIIIWTYYLIEYKSINTNGRDRYIFFWATVLVLAFDVLYFTFRYYNLYLDLKDNNEIVTDEELADMTDQVYFRFYVICGNNVFLDDGMSDLNNPTDGIDTPFVAKRSSGMISEPEIKKIIKEMTGGRDGELKFFFGRKSADISKFSVARFFYFLDGDISDYPDMGKNGMWTDFNMVKRIYSQTPALMAKYALTDLTRLATIMITSKLFNDRGFRKNKLKSYSPSFDLEEVRKTDLSFQDDKWIRISRFNSDTKFYRLKRWLRGLNLKENTQA